MIDITRFTGLETAATDEPPAPISDRTRNGWHHCVTVDGRHFVDGEEATKAKFDGIYSRAIEVRFGFGPADWVLTAPGES